MTSKPCHRDYRSEPFLVLCTFVLHQLLAAVKLQVTVLAWYVSSSPTLILSSNMNSLKNPALNTWWSRCQHRSATPHVLLEAEPSLEGDVADGKADPLACHQHDQVSFLQYLERKGRLHGPPTCVKTNLTFLRSYCHTCCTGPASREWQQVAGDMVPHEVVSSPKGILTGLASVWWWEVHKALTDKEILL